MAQIIGAYDTNVKTSQSALKKVTATTSGTKDSLDVNITNASAVGGGEQYADAYTITGGEKGTVALGSDGTDFKYLKTDSSGNLQVDVVSGTIVANIEGDYVDDSAFTVASDKGLIVGGVFTTDQIDSGDFGAFKINADRELGVFLGESLPTGTNSIGDIANITNVVSVDDNGGSLTVDGTVTATITRAGQIALNTDTGTGNISVQINLGTTLKILGVKIHFAGVPTANDFVVTSNNLAGGSAYDTVLYKADPGTLGVTDLNFVPAGELIIEAGEAVTITFTNAGGTSYGLTTTYELIT